MLENTRVKWSLNGDRPAPGWSVEGDRLKDCLELNRGRKMKPGKGPDDSGESQLELPWPESQKINPRSTLTVFTAIFREKTIAPEKKKCVVSIEWARSFTPGLYSPSQKTPFNCKGIPSFIEKEM